MWKVKILPSTDYRLQLKIVRTKLANQAGVSFTREVLIHKKTTLISIDINITENSCEIFFADKLDMVCMIIFTFTMYMVQSSTPPTWHQKLFELCEVRIQRVCAG